MTSSREYRQFACECTKWAGEAATDEIREFLDLACDWSFAALAVGRVETSRTPRRRRAAAEHDRLRREETKTRPNGIPSRPPLA
jgi:hypothetical protein